MSIVKSHSVFCDGLDGVRADACHGWVAEVTDGEGGARGARQVAKNCGWVRRAGQDICPGCNPDHVHEFDPIYLYQPCRCGAFRPREDFP